MPVPEQQLDANDAFGGIGARTRIGFWAASGLALGLVLLFCGCLASDGDEVKKLETSIVKINTGGQSFDIPMGYFYWEYVKRGRSWPKIKEERTLAQQIRLGFLLPELAPYSASTASAFESLGVGDKVSLVLGENRNPDWLPTYLKNVSSRLDRGVQHPSDAPGLVHLRDTVTQGDVFLMGDPPTKPYFQIICDAPRAGTEQTCHAMADFSTHLTVEYEFSRRHLPQWRGIHNLLVRELGKFAAAAGQPIKGE